MKASLTLFDCPRAFRSGLNGLYGVDVNYSRLEFCSSGTPSSSDIHYVVHGPYIHTI